jgi:hypothetical protein
MRNVLAGITFLSIGVVNAASEPLPIQHYKDDRLFLRLINSEIPQIWEKLPEAKANPGSHSLKSLEAKIAKSKSEALVYFQKNRKYFVLDSDLGGGAYADTNWERLKEGSKNPEVLSFYHGLRLKEVSTAPYCPLKCELDEGGCGDDTEVTETKLEIIKELFKDFPHPNFKAQHRKLLEDYQNSIDEFQNGKRDTCEGSPKNPKDAKIAKLLEPLRETLKQLAGTIQKENALEK